MMHSPRSQPNGTSSSSSALRKVFVTRVHQLLQFGYNRLTPAAYSQAQEPDISGDLHQAIDDVLSERVKPWMDKFSVHDDPPVHDGKRRGKRRKRVDLRIDSGSYSPRARFRFEAKRLGNGHPVTMYLGVEGLGCFLCGDYAREEDHAGMLGYVQAGNLVKWADKISEALDSNLAVYEVDQSFRFAPVDLLNSGSLLGYRSKHHRSVVGKTILIYHVLMQFQ